LNQELSDQTLTETILQITKTQKPETVKQLVNEVHQRFPSASDKEISDAILRLQNEDKIHFTQKQPPSTDLAIYLRTRRSSWYWITIIMTLATVVCVFTIPEEAYPFVIIRYVLGAIFILWLPGYVFIKALFPAGLPTKNPDKNLDMNERVALSVGMSLALVSITGLLLNYTPWGIRLTPITLSLTALTLTFATAGAIREYQSTKNPAT
jgi:hypothetical protein